MSPSSLIELFEQYGWPGVLAIAMILVIYYFVNKKDKKTIDVINSGFTGLAQTISKQNDHLVDAIASSNEKTQQCLLDLISQTIDDKNKERDAKHKKSLHSREVVSKKIDKILHSLMKEVNSQRAIVIEFHNSKQNLDGLSFLWYDIQYERQQKGIVSISSKSKNLQATNIRPIIERVNKSPNHIVMLDEAGIDEIYEESSVLYAHFKELQINHVVYCGLYNTDNNELIGLLGMEYQEGFPYHEDLIDTYSIRDSAVIIENLYAEARKEMDEK